MVNDLNVVRDAMLGRMNAANARPVIDTSTLGPIRLSLSGNALSATLMREALRHIATSPECCQDLPMADRESAWQLATAGSDETLAILYRSIRK